MIQDEDTILKAISGDCDAATLVVSEYEKYINRFARLPASYSKGRDSASIDEDIKSELQVHLLANLPNFKLDGGRIK